MAELSALLAPFHFLRPLWFAAIIPLLTMVWLLRRSASGQGEWHRVLAPEIAALLVGSSRGKAINLSPWLLTLGMVAIVALAGPTWDKKAVPVHKSEQALLILFDLSPSMMASDLKPDRLTRARLKTVDLLNSYDEGTAALIAFAGDAHVVTPLTDDAATIISQLPALSPNIMPASGSNPEVALNLALELLANTGQSTGDILLITDGLTADAMENLQSELREHPGLRLSILGVGTAEGAPIPLNKYGFARDGNGGIVVAKLNAKELRGLAQRNNGVYRTLTGSDADIEALLAPLQARSNDEARELERQLDIWQDQGYWLVLVLIPFALLLFRRGMVVVALLGILPLLYTPESHADWWQDLWQTPDQQGYKALNEGNANEAQSLFENPDWKGVAAAQAEDYEAAIEAFSASDSADSHYNRGNALAKAGKLDEAIEAYDRALELDPAMEDAAFNKSLLEQMKQQQNNPQSSDDQQDNSGGEGDSSDSQQQQNGSQGQSDDSQESQQGSQGSPDNSQQEKGSQQNGEQQNDGQSPDRQKPDQSGANQNSAGGEEHQNEGSSANNANKQEQTGEAAPTTENPAATGDQSDGEQTPENSADSGMPENTREEPPTGDEQSASASEGTPGDEQTQQWLRRIPDDPGGLLKKKFQYQAEQRFRAERQGQRPPPDRFSEERW